MSSCWKIVLGWAMVFSCGACATATPVERQDKSGECTALAAQAEKPLRAEIAMSQACSEDKDCVLVPMAASCFDRCTAGMSAANQERYRAQVEAVNAKQCHAYQAAGCSPAIVPPCAPPGPAVCQAGKCQVK
jgi:hypothetical protein